MRIAAIDLGTNTFHLIIAEQNANELQIVYKTNQPVKLGEDITKDNCIIPVAFERGINCLKEFKNSLLIHDVTIVKATATSAVRSASNGQKFVDAVKQATDIDIEIIDGDEEAELIYEGVKLSGVITGKSLIMDIGGGSTEFILCDEENLIWKKSYNIGAARLMQKFFKTDPISKTEIDQINEHIASELKALKVIVEEYQPKTLIGSAGAFETFASMINPSMNIAETSTADIYLKDYLSLSNKLISSTHAEREAMPNLIPLRVDMIVMASLLTNYVVQTFELTEIKLSTYDLKMGVLQSLKS